MVLDVINLLPRSMCTNSPKTVHGIRVNECYEIGQLRLYENDKWLWMSGWQPETQGGPESVPLNYILKIRNYLIACHKPIVVMLNIP